MNRLMALIQREYWENKGAFRTTPVVIGGIYIVGMLMAIFTTVHFDNDLYTFKEAVRLAASQPHRPTTEFLDQGREQGAVQSVETRFIDLESV